MARPKLGEGDTQRLQLKISDEELEAIDDWRFANRVPSRSEAVRRLCQMGIALDQIVEPGGKKAEQVLETSSEMFATINGKPTSEHFDIIADWLYANWPAAFSVLVRVVEAGTISDALKSGEDIEAALAHAKGERDAFAKLANELGMEI